MKFPRSWTVGLLLVGLASLAGLRGSTADGPAPTPAPFPAPKNTQAETQPLLTPPAALATVRVPAGFSATLFAAEPDIQQPLHMSFDGRGRLWVTENYTYADRKTNFDLTQRDRIVILEDADGDGRAEQRKVFWDQGQRLTSVEVGFGGVWAMAPPYLYFIPDRNGDDVPDGEPVVMLDGWDDRSARHNFTNGLRWGPDGWLYGRNGILATSYVGRPGTPADRRTPINCALWRFHPTRRLFEVVCSGTTNPFGHDWDQHGQLFFINTVIGHLWHALPGAHFRRMYGEDLNPHVYELIEQTADHVHWHSAAEDWTALRNAKMSDATDRAGGGHAHSGLLIYQGDNWPAEYRGEMFTINLHGRRVNRDHIERHGATYVGRHRPDFLHVGDAWFRGLDLVSGPDGGVYLNDWTDIGECHDDDGIHRTSGRIYKVMYTPTAKRAAVNIDQLPPRELAALVQHPNDWYARQARRRLQELAAQGTDLRETRQSLAANVAGEGEVVHRLRALWALHATGGVEPALLRQALRDRDEQMRTWAVQLLTESQPVAPAVAKSLTEQAQRETSGLVLTYLASALQRLAPADRWPLAKLLVQHGEFATDRVLPLMIWYGVESAVPQQPAQAVELIGVSKLPNVSQHVARRVTTDIDQQPDAAAQLVRLLSTQPTSRTAILTGMTAALRGRHKATPPAGWNIVAAKLAQDADGEVRRLTTELSVVFGDGRALDQIRQLALDEKQSLDARRQAIRSLVQVRAEGLAATLFKLLEHRDLAEDAVRGLAVLNPPGAAEALVARYRNMYRPGRLAAVDALAGRPASARRLLDAVEKGGIERQEVAAHVLRQMQLLGDAEIAARVSKLWPELRLIAGDKLAVIADYRRQLTAERLAAGDLATGKKLYAQHCGKCHKLFGEGGDIAPELTGGQRTNLVYWLENIVDPSAVVAASFRMSTLRLDDGRVVNGVVVNTTDRELTVQTPTEKLVLPRSSVVETKSSDLSLMPDGLLASLPGEQVRDLVAFLMSPPPIPAGAAKPKPAE